MMRNSDDELLLTDDPEWYRDAIIYELHVRAFFDASGDGIGDFKGLIEKLDYLQDLGVTALWLLPFYPSPLRDDGYDIADYRAVHRSYGTLTDFRRFLREAHRRGLRVITELVVNHTSADHPWFQRARRARSGSKHRNFYVWSDTPDRYGEARIIFQDFETSNWTWDPIAGAYYWHRFYSHQPDLNFDNPEVRKALFKVVDFWMDMGVDGMRLDAVPYLYEREGTNCENLPQTHVFLKELRSHIEGKYKNRMLLAEANQWPEDAAAYFGDGDECHMNFHFPLMPRMFMAVHLENNFPILDIMRQTPEIPEGCQWAVFLRNHDELTLEMVTDEDRDYMYRVYADDPQARINLGIRRRLAPLLKVRRKIELMNGLLLSLPGTPVIYYGDEIGQGDNIYLGDRDSVRTPMQWSGDRNAGFSKANPQKMYLPVILDPEYHFEANNVEVQQDNSTSLLWWMKRLIALRKRYQVFGRGDIEFLEPENPTVLCFIRTYGSQRLLVVANLSRFPQYVELALREYAGMVPVELFGQHEFPPIGELPYLLTLGPHNFLWFMLETPAEDERGTEAPALPTITYKGHWMKVFEGRRARAVLERALSAFVAGQRWFRGKAHKIKSASLVEAVPFGDAMVTFVEVDYGSQVSEAYVIPIAHATGDEASWLESEHSFDTIARVRSAEEQQGIVFDGTVSPEFASALLRSFGRRRVFAGAGGQIVSRPFADFRRLRGSEDEMRPSLLKGEQSNTNIVYGDRFMLKLFRSVESGPNPELEMSRFLSRPGRFPHVPRIAGALEYHTDDDSPSTVALLQEFVANQGDAWQLTLDALQRFFEAAVARSSELDALPTRRWADPGSGNVPEDVATLIGPHLSLVRLLAIRTAELHLALVSDPDDPAFAPEAFTTLYQRSRYQAARSQLSQVFQLLRKNLRKLPDEVAAHASAVLGEAGALDARLKRILGHRIDAVRTRIHGDFHLGQVLYTGKDFVFIDFEGQPVRPASERRFKQSPLRDVCSMVRSFQYASAAALRDARVRPEDAPHLGPWADFWYGWVSDVFVRHYLDAAREAPFIPADADDLATLLDFYLIDTCVYEVGYELAARPDWIDIPLRNLAALLGAP